jgi:hypothetical protein
MIDSYFVGGQKQPDLSPVYVCKSDLCVYSESCLHRHEQRCQQPITFEYID